ncbi:MAG: low molecular weight phosphotyrosine protein phosphatase [Bacteroidetes bacterium]|nr:low molecular weight phosphotyrosine protein phosphatase [Bacteroidota bacterium]MBS1756712.1 low molecular weight phosphotyrosine protein phosphatase [Bacteroidota bacterium]
MKILMVCLGNICRSPLAEGILLKSCIDAGLHWQIDSAGTNGYHTGEPPHHLSQKVAKKNGIDISSQVSRKFKKEDILAFDRIYVMADDVMQEVKKIAGNYFDKNKVDYFLNELHPSKNLDVPDPWYGDEDGYDEAYQLIDEACAALLKNYFATLQTTQSNV